MLQALLSDFMVRATLAGLGVAVAAAPLGCLVLWRRMAFFADATAHASLFGVALALAVPAPVSLGVLAGALAMAVAVDPLSRRLLSADTVLAVLSHSALAAGLLAVAFVPGVRVDLSAFLFGDILAVSRADLAVIWAGAAAILGLVAWRWSALVTATVDPDLARAAGIDPDREALILAVALALVVAVAIKVVGVLLISAMLIVPAAAARPLATGPGAMAAIAAAIAALSVLAGLQASLWHDLPAGPAIVCCAVAAFAAATGIAASRGAR